MSRCRQVGEFSGIPLPLPEGAQVKHNGEATIVEKSGDSDEPVYSEKGYVGKIQRSLTLNPDLENNLRFGNKCKMVLNYACDPRNTDLLEAILLKISRGRDTILAIVPRSLHVRVAL